MTGNRGTGTPFSFPDPGREKLQELRDGVFARHWSGWFVGRNMPTAEQALTMVEILKR
jgi:hypothetical protein